MAGRSWIVVLAAVLLAGCGGDEGTRTAATSPADEETIPSDFPTGTYRATITTADEPPPGFNVFGRWTLELGDSGAWSLSGRFESGSNWQTSGAYAVSGDELTILSDVICGPGEATFTWRFDGQMLDLDPVSEDCAQVRTVHLTAKLWTKVD